MAHRKFSAGQLLVVDVIPFDDGVSVWNFYIDTPSKTLGALQSDEIVMCLQKFDQKTTNMYVYVLTRFGPGWIHEEDLYVL